MSAIAVSSFSLRQQLGPVRIEYIDEFGHEQEYVMAYPALLGFGEFARRVREEFGVDEIELCQIQLGPLDELEDGGAARLRTELDAAGVRVRNVPIDIGDLGSTDAARRARDAELTLRWFDVAATLGSRFVRVNAGTPLGSGPDRNALVAELAALGDAAAERGLRMLVENHGGLSSDPEFLTGLVDAVGGAHLGILLDLGNLEPMLAITHAAFTGAPVPTAPDFAPLYAAISRLAPHAELVHAKSYGIDATGRPSSFDARAALEALAASSYAGPVTIEYEGEHGDPWQWTQRVTALAREVLG
ncbi:sugar phosphate isomerase/epimerase family protein [Gryllotalpicola koreensis]|uniref:Xylose isomerase-like TIM barrel domain-containing protein n=1 Tax=Gryllotalpicola koreensis TaxID=993086 RepID=A0ABP8ACX3_9MICO